MTPVPAAIWRWIHTAADRMEQVATPRNNGPNLASLAFVLDALPGPTATNAPLAGPYRECRAMPNGT